MAHIDAEILIIGAGPVGCTLAALLGKAGIECTLLNTTAGAAAKTDSGPDPRALALTHASVRILQNFALWRQLPEERIGHFSAMQVWDENGTGRVEFNSAELCESRLGHIVEQTLIQTGLDKVIAALPAVTVHTDLVVLELSKQDDKITIALNDGRRLSAGLIVAADGVHSQVRELAGIEYKIHDYGQSAMACVVHTSLPHEHIARQRFLTHGPLAFLPMAESNQCGIVWSTLPEHAQHLLNSEESAFKTELQQAFDHTLGEVVACGPRVVFPLKRAQAKCYCQDRLALVGDAAHSVHPLAGQGFNLGLLDAASLFEVIQAAKQRHKDAGTLPVLRRYERWRKGENYFMMMAFEGFKYLFENQSRPVPQLRNAGMHAFNHLPPLKQKVMRWAMGLEGDLPELARAG